VKSAIGMIVVSGLLACQNANPLESAEAFYELMLATEKGDNLVLNHFPKVLKPMEHLYQGNIFKTEKDTLQLVCSYPNQNDTVNRYPFYFMRDNHGNYWSMFHEKDDRYHIYREDSEKAKDWFKDKQASLDEKNNKWLKVPSIPMGLLFNKEFLIWQNYQYFYSEIAVMCSSNIIIFS